MNPNWFMWWGDRAIFIVSCGVICLWTPSAHAQIRADDTLSTPTRVEERRPGQFVIEDGTQRDRLLFHSFQEFSVPTRGQASFRGIDPSIGLILMRVTGRSASSINGAIEVLQDNGSLSNADVFFLNPNGIIFGRNASLRLGGSFLATTAESVVFDNGTLFSATNPQDAPLLNIDVPLGLQFGQRPGSIENASIVDTSERNFSGLTVAANQTLALIGGDLLFSGGAVTAPSGRVELGSVGEQEFVAITLTQPGFQLDYTETSDFQTIRFENFASVIVDGDGNAGLQIQGNDVVLNDESVISSGSLGTQDDAPLTIRANNLEINDFSLISTVAFDAGNAGDLDIRVNSLTARNGGQLASLTLGAGDTGDLRIRASDTVELSGFEIDRGNVLPSGILTQVDDLQVTGNAGDIRLRTENLRLLNGAQISTTTFGTGDAGNLHVVADRAELSGSATRNGRLIIGDLGQRYGSGLYTSAELDATGQGGDLFFEGNQLYLNDGAVLQTVTFSEGNAGDLTVNVSEIVEISGVDQDGLFPTSLVTASGGIPGADYQFSGIDTATGQAGNLFLTTENLRVLDGGAIAVGSLNPNLESVRNSGNLRIQANDVRLDQGLLLAETAAGDGGNITLRQTQLLFLRQVSAISTTAGTEQTGGDGGDILINADFVLSALPENSDITANAFEGSGGNVNITTDSLIGLLFQPEPTLESDITASSQFGLDGTVVINTIDIDPTQGVIELPDTLLDASRLVRQDCRAANREPEIERSQFYVTGRGGLPDTPQSDRSAEQIAADWIDLSNLPESDAAVLDHSTFASSPIVEAQHWEFNEQGHVVLIASSASSTVNPSWESTYQCPSDLERAIPGPLE